MPFLLAILALCLPRFTIALLWLLSSWFEGVFDTRLWPILGFLFLPLTLLWFSVVTNWFDGDWNWWRVIVLLLAIAGDLDTGKRASR